MSFDLPANVERDIREYANKEQISPEEAITKLVLEALKVLKVKAKATSLSKGAKLPAGLRAAITDGMAEADRGELVTLEQSLANLNSFKSEWRASQT